MTMMMKINIEDKSFNGEWMLIKKETEKEREGKEMNLSFSGNDEWMSMQKKTEGDEMNLNFNINSNGLNGEAPKWEKEKERKGVE